MDQLISLIPIAIFLLICTGIAFYVHRKHSGGNFVQEYFIGSRSMGAFVLAMTTIATYGSVSSFVGGPGQAWDYGFAWVYMAVCQVTALFLLYGIMGKKLALIGRKIKAVTIIDIIRARYQSNLLANISAIVIVIFFVAMMVAQFVGGAKLFEAVTGYSYLIGLIIFGGAVIIYTTVGGFRGVVLTDALCGIAMLIGIVVLAFGILSVGGGYENIMTTISETKPTLLEVDANGNMAIGLYFTQWLLVGILTFVLPQSTVRCLGFKNTKSLRNAMILGTIIMGAMMIGVTSLGVLAKGVLPGTLADYGSSVDNIIPLTVVSSLPPLLAGITIIGPIAASISTVSSLLIASSSSIIKDMYLHHCEERGKEAKERTIAFSSQIITLLLGLFVFVLAIVPPDVIWRINMFSFGGLETAFFWVLVMGLFWKRATKTGAILSIVGGVLAYCATMAMGITFMSLHQIVIGISVSFVLMVVGSLATQKQNTPAMRKVFFPEYEE